MKVKVTTNSAVQTALFAENLGKKIKEPLCLVFNGGLGVGKTCFATGFCRGLGYQGDVNSPTFSIVNEYYGGRFPIFHFDLYRICGEEELYALGFYDYLEQDGILLLEWGENMGNLQVENSLLVQIAQTNEHTREITVTGAEKYIKDLSI